MAAPLTLALWPVDLSVPAADLATFGRRLQRRVGEAKAAEAAMLVLPEYVSEAWLTGAPAGLPETTEVAWMAEQGALFGASVAALSQAADLAILAGSWPAAQPDGSLRNRAHLYLPDGTVQWQDKLSLTPDERDPAAWLLSPGTRLEVMAWRGLRLAVIICLDIEQPSLATRLQALDLDLVLVPSDTAHPSGHARVFGCAKARAIELCCVVAAVGGIGTIPLDPPRHNTAGAAVYVPCEMALAGGTGVLADTGPLQRHDDALVIVQDVPFDRLRALRRAGPEVWLPHWSATDITIVDPPAPSQSAPP